MHPRYKALHWRRPALHGKGAPIPPCPGLSTLGQTPCSWETSLIEGCQLCDAQMQIRGSRHPVENRNNFHPVEVFDILEGLWHCFHFSNCIPCFASASPYPPHLLSAPSLLCLCSFSLPRRSGLHVTPVAKAAAASYRVTWMCRSQELSRKRALQAACNQPSLACPRHPTAIPTSQLLGEELSALLWVNAKTWLLVVMPIFEKKCNLCSDLKANVVAGFWVIFGENFSGIP